MIFGMHMETNEREAVTRVGQGLDELRRQLEGGIDLVLRVRPVDMARVRETCERLETLLVEVLEEHSRGVRGAACGGGGGDGAEARLEELRRMDRMVWLLWRIVEGDSEEWGRHDPNALAAEILLGFGRVIPVRAVSFGGSLDRVFPGVTCRRVVLVDAVIRLLDLLVGASRSVGVEVGLGRSGEGVTIEFECRDLGGGSDEGCGVGGETRTDEMNLWARVLLDFGAIVEWRGLPNLNLRLCLRTELGGSEPLGNAVLGRS